MMEELILEIAKIGGLAGIVAAVCLWQVIRQNTAMSKRLDVVQDRQVEILSSTLKSNTEIMSKFSEKFDERPCMAHKREL